MIDLTHIMTTTIKGHVKNGSAISRIPTVRAASKWLRQHKQINNGKNYEKIHN